MYIKHQANLKLLDLNYLFSLLELFGLQKYMDLKKSLFKRSVFEAVRDIVLVCCNLNCFISLFFASAASLDNSPMGNNACLITSAPWRRILRTDGGRWYQVYSSTSFLAVSTAYSTNFSASIISNPEFIA